MFKKLIKINYHLLLSACILLLTECIIVPVLGQAPNKTDLQTIVTINVKDEPFHKVLSLIEGQCSFRFAYNAELIYQLKNVTLNANQVSLNELMALLFRGSSINYSIVDNQIILQKITLPEKITISGYAREGKTGELLAGTSIFLLNAPFGTLSNNYGFYSLTIPPADSLELVISYVGYGTIYRKIGGQNNLTLNVNLVRREEAVSSIIFNNDKREEHVKKNQLANNDIAGDMLTVNPSIIGNGDVMNSVQQLPGVQAGLDGTPGYFVRGGNADQNQVLLDEATLYNPSHLFGLVSVFNSAAVRKATLMKGGFPAAYGDYLSSVLDVSMKDGNNEKFGGDIQLGSIASAITLNGPIQLHKASYLLSARRSTIDFLLRPFAVKNYFSDYYFYDLNGKLNYQFSHRDRLYLSVYQGSDKGSYSSVQDDSEDNTNYQINFGNQALTLRWNHLYSKKLFSNLSFIHSNYFQRLSAVQGDYFAQLYSGIKDFNIKSDFYYYPHAAHRIRGGLNYLYQTLYPATISNRISAIGFVNIRPNDIPAKNNNRVAAYLSDDIRVTKLFQVYAGVRFPVFFNASVHYMNVEPRLSLLFMLSPTSSIKAAYNRMHQYIHLVQSYNAAFPAEIWIGSSSVVKPQASHQITAGYFKNFKENIYQASLEGYYKLMENQSLFKGGTQATVDNDIENKLIFGKGWSYGTECIIKKNKGKLKGWLAYSLSKAYQQFDSLNEGNAFPFAHNRMHSLYFSASHSLDQQQHWRISTTLFITSGSSVTLINKSAPPTQNPDDNPLFDDEDNSSTSGNIESTPNNFRLTPYNRLDISVSHQKTRTKGTRSWQTEWVFAVYNAYGHRNTNFAYRYIDPVSKQPSVKQISIIPIVPSITYRLSL